MEVPDEVWIVLVNLFAVVSLFWVGYTWSESHVPTWVGGQFTGGFLLSGAWLGVVSVFIVFRR